MSSFAQRMRRAFACVFLILPLLMGAVVPASAAGTATIAGVVADSQTGLPLSNVAVSLKGTKTATTTDTRGAFVFNGLAAGTYVLEVRANGYVPSESTNVVVAEGATAQVTLSIDRTQNGTSEALR